MAMTEEALGALAPHVRLVRLRAEAALVRRLNAGYGFADSRTAAHLYLRDDEARERLGRDSLKPQDTHLAQTVELAGAIDEASEALAGHRSRLTTLAERFRLSPAEAAVVTVALAYELDPDVRDLAHALAGRRRGALHADVAGELDPVLSDPQALLAALHPAGILRRAGLVDVADRLEPGTARVAAPLSLERRAIDWLAGDDRIAEPLHDVVAVIAAEVDLEVHLDRDTGARLDEVAARLGGDDRVPPAVLIQGPIGAGKLAIAHRLAARLGRPLAVVPLGAVAGVERRTGTPELVRRALSDAAMRGAVAYLPDIESLFAGTEGKDVDPVATAAIEQHAGILAMASSARGMPSLPIRRPFHLIRPPQATLELRRQIWQHGLDRLHGVTEPAVTAPGTAELLAGRYVIGPGTVADVIRDARQFAAATGQPVSINALEESIGRRLTLRLGAFGTVVSRRARFEEMVLPEEVVEALRDMIAMVRERSRILERWGYGQHLGLSRGVSALFTGEPGTGKTMAASVISSELGLELVRIDLSSVVSKWVGETEKHLSRIFDEAQSANAMLLFDEADSLFGKRTELKSAQDRYANLEVNYILQRMETFDGISILTSNFENAIDKAFVRRLNFRVRFPEPEVDEREQLWRRLLPPDAGVDGEVDFSTLAERFDMTGGHIRNAIVRAAVIAARENRGIRSEDVLAGAHHEYRELGKVMPEL
jgi:hypothetical protein